MIPQGRAVLSLDARTFHLAYPAGRTLAGAQHALMHGDQGTLLFLAKLLIGADGCRHVGRGMMT